MPQQRLQAPVQLQFQVRIQPALPAIIQPSVQWSEAPNRLQVQQYALAYNLQWQLHYSKWKDLQLVQEVWQKWSVHHDPHH